MLALLPVSVWCVIDKCVLCHIDVDASCNVCVTARYGQRVTKMIYAKVCNTVFFCIQFKQYEMTTSLIISTCIFSTLVEPWLGYFEIKPVDLSTDQVIVI